MVCCPLYENFFHLKLITIIPVSILSQKKFIYFALLNENIQSRITINIPPKPNNITAKLAIQPINGIAVIIKTIARPIR